MLRLYNTILIPIRAGATLWALASSRSARRDEWQERRARRFPPIRPGGAWIHGSSVGEARIVGKLAERLSEVRQDLAVALSCTTPTGRAVLAGSGFAPSSFFAPLDFRGLPGRALDALRPAVLVLVETELWPNLLHEAATRAVPVAIVNARLGPERMRRYRALRKLYRPLLGGIRRIGAQSAEDAERYAAIGADPSRISVTGNIKYDLPAPGIPASVLRERFDLDADRPVLAAGSTGPGEEPPVLEAYATVRAAFPRAFLVLAPRHPERTGEVERLAAERGFRVHRLSKGPDRDASRNDILLVDTIGELAALYAMTSAAFVGGSLVPIGGHNVLEPAAAGVPVLFGPHTHHVAGPADHLLRSGAAIRVSDAEALGRAWTDLLRHPERRSSMAAGAARLVQRNGGALQRSVDLLLSLIDPAGAASENHA